ncbi:MAG: T9SS type A sorting domain-containing protein [Bacteroidetes bacterium]|nr:T9SS type A sorting domain-containing protein [Bacteroidota bacterium]
MKKLFTLLVLIHALTLNAQRAEWLNVSTISPGGSGYSTRSLIAADNDKSAYTFREFSDGFIVATDTQYAVGAIDLSIIKTDSAGNHIWSKVIGTNGNDTPEDICTDSDGNIYISAFLEGQSTIMDDTTYSNSTLHQIIKLGSDGQFIRSYATSDLTIITCNGTDVFAANASAVFKLDSAFNQNWSKSFPLNTLGFSIGTSRNKISSFGHYLAFSANEFFSSAGPVIVDTVAIPFTGANMDQSCVVLMDTNGAAYWARVTDGNNVSNEFTGGACTDVQGNVYLAASCDQDFVHGSDTLHLNGGNTVAGVLKFDPNGNPVWAGHIQTSGHVNCTNIKSDVSGNVFVIGNMDGVVQIGTYTSSSQASGSYVGEYAPSGAINFVKFNSSGANSGSVFGLDVHSSGDFWIAGSPAINTAWDCLNTPTVGTIITPSYWGRFTMQNSISPIADFSYIINGNAYTFTNLSSNTDSVNWDFGDGTFSNLPDPVHVFSTGLNYTVVLTAHYGICTDTDTLFIVGVGVDENDRSPLFSIYPSPANEFIQLNSQASMEKLHIILLDISGRTLLEQTVHQNTYSCILSTQDLPDGIYFLNIMNEDGKKVIRFVVQH